MNGFHNRFPTALVSDIGTGEHVVTQLQPQDEQPNSTNLSLRQSAAEQCNQLNGHDAQASVHNDAIDVFLLKRTFPESELQHASRFRDCDFNVSAIKDSCAI